MVWPKNPLVSLSRLIVLAVILGSAFSASGQIKSLDRLRQLPDLGACPTDGSVADPSLKAALAAAVKEARAEAKDLAALVAKMKGSSLLPSDELAKVSSSSDALTKALASTDDCGAARAVARINPAVATPAAEPAAATAPAEQVVAPPTQDGTCEHSSAPCIDQPLESDQRVTGKLSAAKGTFSLAIGDKNIAIDTQDKNQYNAATGIFTIPVPALNGYNAVELALKDPAGNVVSRGPAVQVLQSISCDKAAGRRPCLTTPHAGDTEVSGEIAAKNNVFDPKVKVTVKVNGVAAGDPVTPDKNGNTFTFKKSGLTALKANDTIEADQTAAVDGSSNSTGPVRVADGKTLTEGITVDQASLDFGHQSMGTASSSKQVVVTNKTGAPVKFDLLTAADTPTDFQVSGCQDAVNNNDHCTFNVVFAPFPSNHLALRESYIAVVPEPEKEKFEQLRLDLNAKQRAADVALEQWRRDMRCRDHNVECQTAAQSDQVNQGECQEGSTEGSDKLGKADRADSQFKCYERRRDLQKQALSDLHAQFHLINVTAIPDHWMFPFTRAVVGLDMSAPTSRTIKESYFIDFDLLAPFSLSARKKNLDPLENRLFFWLNPRITSLPQATNFSTVSSINETGSFFNTSQTLNQLVSGFDVNGGIDIALIKPRDGIPWWGEYANTQAKLTPSLIFGAGMSTPFSTDSTEVTSSVTQAICDAFAAPAGQKYSVGVPKSSQGGQGLVCTFIDPTTNKAQSTPFIQVNPTGDPNNGVRSNITFYQQDRSRFFRRYYVGLRLKTYFFRPDLHSYCQPFEKRHLDEGDCAVPYDIFPGIIDLTVGQDESVTRGRPLGLVARMEAVYPLPWYPGLHIFGSVLTKIHGVTQFNQPVSGYTIVTPANGAATDLNTFRFALQPLDRDYFRIGIGVDLIQVFKKTGQPSKAAPQAPSSTPGAS